VQPGAPFTGNGFDRYSIGITAVGMNFMARLPLLRNERFANGRLQPYLGVGPAIFFTEVTFRPFGGNISPAGQATQTASATALGVQGVTGVKYFISPRFSVFAEYKFSHVETEVRSSISNGAARAETFKTSLDLTTHHAVGGIAFHFDAV
jgi:opacity protein-like surface antigen